MCWMVVGHLQIPNGPALRLVQSGSPRMLFQYVYIAIADLR